MVFDPLRDEAFVASRGYGAQLNGKRLRVTRLPSLDGAIIGTGIPYRQKAAHLQPYLGMAGAVTQEAADLRRAGSAALDLARRRRALRWLLGAGSEALGHAAGALLVTEAGELVICLAAINFCSRPHRLRRAEGFKGLLQKIAPHVTDELRGR